MKNFFLGMLAMVVLHNTGVLLVSEVVASITLFIEVLANLMTDTVTEKDI